MKTRNSFFATLLIVILIASCTDNPSGDDGFQQRRIGSFLLTSETTANWVGNAAVKNNTQISAGDTIYYDQPDQNNLEVIAIQANDTLFVNYVYTDSTLTAAFYDTSNAGQYIYSYLDGNYSNTQGAGFKDDYTRFEAGLPYSCDSTYSQQPEEIVIEVRTKQNEGIYSRRQLDVNGLYNAVHALVCE